MPGYELLNVPDEKTLKELSRLIQRVDENVKKNTLLKDKMFNKGKKKKYTTKQTEVKSKIIEDIYTMRGIISDMTSGKIEFLTSIQTQYPEVFTQLLLLSMRDVSGGADEDHKAFLSNVATHLSKNIAEDPSNKTNMGMIGEIATILEGNFTRGQLWDKQGFFINEIITGLLEKKVVHPDASTKKFIAGIIIPLINEMHAVTFNSSDYSKFREKILNYSIEDNTKNDAILKSYLEKLSDNNFLKLCQPTDPSNIFYKAVSISTKQPHDDTILEKLFQKILDLGKSEMDTKELPSSKKIIMQYKRKELFGDSSKPDSIVTMSNILNALIMGAAQVTDKEALKSLLELSKTKYNEIENHVGIVKHDDVRYRNADDNDLFLLAIEKNLSSIEIDKNVLQIFAPYLAPYWSRVICDQLIKNKDKAENKVNPLVKQVIENLVQANDFDGLSVILKEYNNKYRSSANPDIGIAKVIALEYFTKDALRDIAANMAGKILVSLNKNPRIFDKIIFENSKDPEKKWPLDPEDSNIYVEIIKNLDLEQLCNQENIKQLLKIPTIMKLVCEDKTLLEKIKTFKIIEAPLDKASSLSLTAKSIFSKPDKTIVGESGHPRASKS